MPRGSARAAAMLVQQGMISEVARKVGRKVASAFVKPPERALVAPRSILQRCPSVRSSIWPKLAALRGHVFDPDAFRRGANASQCSWRS